jgi:hypothetical protein
MVSISETYRPVRPWQGQFMVASAAEDRLLAPTLATPPGLAPSAAAPPRQRAGRAVLNAITTRLLQQFATGPAGLAHPAVDNLAALGITAAASGRYPADGDRACARCSGHGRRRRPRHKITLV